MPSQHAQHSMSIGAYTHMRSRRATRPESRVASLIFESVFTCPLRLSPFCSQLGGVGIVHPCHVRLGHCRLSESNPSECLLHLYFICCREGKMVHRPIASLALLALAFQTASAFLTPLSIGQLPILELRACLSGISRSAHRLCSVSGPLFPMRTWHLHRNQKTHTRTHTHPQLHEHARNHTHNTQQAPRLRLESTADMPLLRAPHRD